MCIEKMYIMKFGDAIFYKCQLGLVNNVFWDFSNRSFLSKFFINSKKRVLKFLTMVIDLSLYLSSLFHEF